MSSSDTGRERGCVGFVVNLSQYRRGRGVLSELDPLGVEGGPVRRTTKGT